MTTFICSGQIEICKTCMNGRSAIGSHTLIQNASLDPVPKRSYIQSSQLDPKTKLARAALNSLGDFCADGHIVWGVWKVASHLTYSLTCSPFCGLMLDYTHSNPALLNATGLHHGSVAPTKENKHKDQTVDQ